MTPEKLKKKLDTLYDKYNRRRYVHPDPLDTHMHRISLALNLTKRKQANMAAALEITSGFKKIVPDDPVKYDFVLTRLGIRDDMVLTLTTSKR